MRPVSLCALLLALPLPRLSAQVGAIQAPTGTAALTGTFFDLKLTQDRAPSRLSIDGYIKVVYDFLNHNWDESILDNYYRTTLPLATTQVFVPMMGSGNAPRAFGVEKYAKPRLWIAWYKGQVTPPTPGRWRFWGYGDDLCAVAINGKTVLFSGRFNAPWPATEDGGAIGSAKQGGRSHEWSWPNTERGVRAGNGELAPSAWIDFKPGEVADIDIILGDLPGGVYGTFVMIEKEGDTYAQLKGKSILPIFQVAPYDTPVGNRGDEPVFAGNGPVWKAIQ